MSNKIEINLDKLTEKERKEWIEKLQAVDINKPVKKWQDLDEVEGFFIGSNSELGTAINMPSIEKNKNVCKTKKQALSSLAYAQLTQLMADVNGYWEADWTDDNQGKWCLLRFVDEFWIDFRYSEYCFLAFPTREKAEEFLENHRELIEQFYQL